MHSSVMPLSLMTPSRKYQNFSKRNLQNRHYFRQHCIAKMPGTKYNSAFVILFNFSDAAERQEFYFRHFGNALTLYAIFMSTLVSIETLRKITPIDNSVIKYYPDLDFLDISDNIDKVNKKKSKN